MKEIDATNRTLGRVASEAAMSLMGKDKPDYESNKVTGSKVKIVNASKLKITEVRKSKVYTRYSGYPGGLKLQTMKDMLQKKGVEEVLRKAIYGMIPNNRLRTSRMKNLTIVD